MEQMAADQALDTDFAVATEALFCLMALTMALEKQVPDRLVFLSDAAEVVEVLIQPDPRLPLPPMTLLKGFQDHLKARLAGPPLR